MAGEALLIVSIVLVAGAVAKIIGDRFEVPSIMFLLIFGIILGPSFLDIVSQSVFEGALSSIVGFAVAIIVFEGAFHLQISRIRRSGKSSVRLITIGAIIAFVGTAGCTYFIIDVGIQMSLLISALLIATGPTVITPIMSVVDVRPPVETTMETEGIVNDVTAAILAVVVFEAVIVPDDESLVDFVYQFSQRLFVGILVGIVGAYILYNITKIIQDQKNSQQDIEILVLVSSVAMFAGANYLATEAGIAAVAVAGFTLGNLDFPFRQDVGRFADNITPVVLSAVFIILAALVELQVIIDLFWYEGLILVLLIIFVIRPVLVFVSCYNGLLTNREKLFISFVGPRGIIPASVASLFAIDLRAIGMVAEADILVSTVFLVIFATVFIEGGPARYIAERLKISPMNILIVGGGQNGRKLAERLQGHRDESVTIIEKNKKIADNLRSDGFSSIHGDGTSMEVLEEAGIESATIVAAMTNNDDTNLLVVNLAESNFNVENTYAKINNEENKEAFTNLGINTISSSEATAIEFNNMIERPTVTKWMDNLGSEGDISDIKMENEEYDGLKLTEFNEKLPDNCLVSLIKRDDEVIIPDGDTKVYVGDQLTFVMEKGKIHDVRFICQGED